MFDLPYFGNNKAWVSSPILHMMVLRVQIVKQFLNGFFFLSNDKCQPSAAKAVMLAKF